MKLFQGPGILPEGLESSCIHGVLLRDWSRCRATEPPQDQGVPPGGEEPFPGIWSPPEDMDSSWQTKPSQDKASFLRKWSPSWCN